MLDQVPLYWRGLSPKTQRLALGLTFGALAPIPSSLIAGALDAYLNVHAPNMVFLCSVILAAIWFGRTVATASAIFAFFIYNFYLTEPRGSFAFAGWEDVLTLLIFCGVALLIGGLAGNLHDERERAEEQVRIFADLFAVSRPLAECSDANTALRLLADGVRQMAGQEGVIFTFDRDANVNVAYCAPADAAPPETIRSAARNLLKGQPTSESPEPGWRLQGVLAGNERVAALAWRPLRRAQPEQLAIAVRLLIELTGIAIQRAQYMKRQLEMETLAATERLRTALMSSISHDFRTPLSTILTSSSSLLTYGEQFSPTTRADLLTSIQEEAERLNRFIGNIMDMTRLDAGALKPRFEWTDPLEVLDNVEERIRRRVDARKLDLHAPAAAPSICVDRVLLEQALYNVAENALIHTPPGSRINLGVSYADEEVELWVEDNGPGVPHADLERIFDKFQRLQASGDRQGAGLGLAISKGFVDAMSGHISAQASEGGGLKIVLAFPHQAAMAAT